MLRFEGVTRTYQAGELEVEALRGIDLAVQSASVTAVMGPSGCGKSTLLTIAGGLQPPDSGRVHVAGTRIDDLSEDALNRHRRRSLGYVFQEFNLVQMLTAIENVALPSELDGLARREARNQASEALDAVGVGELADRFPETLSGGQQQRVALARAVCGRQRLILADEPTGALDSANAEQVMAVLVGLVREGASCVIGTHDPQVAAHADRVVTMRDGLLEHGAPA